MSGSCIANVYYYFHTDPFINLQQIAIKIFKIIFGIYTRCQQMKFFKVRKIRVSERYTF